jgi:hypothetical protein
LIKTLQNHPSEMPVDVLERYTLPSFCGDKLMVSFSGGLTSAMLSYMIRSATNPPSTVFVFANTGLENEETLEFVHRCDAEFKLSVVWLEAVVDPRHGKGIRHRVVNFKTAARSGEPFEAFVSKSGIPNANKPQCSDRLKALVIESYKKAIGWAGCMHAIGIRADEERRRSKSAEKYNLCYPMLDFPGFICTKADVASFWEKQNFTLNLEPHEGNCKTCWKKSDRKLALLALEHPERFDFMRRIEREYAHVKPNDNGQARVFFRRNRSVDDIFRELTGLDISDAVELRKMIGAKCDKEEEESGCSESCEAYS